MRDWYEAKDLVGLPGMPGTVRGVSKLALRDGWEFRQRKGRGGGREFRRESLPLETRQHLELATAIPATLITQVLAPAPLPALPKPPIAPISLAQERKATKKYQLLQLYGEALDAAPPKEKMQARADFMIAYNSGISYPALFAALGEVSWQTIEGWKRTVKVYHNDFYALADRRGNRRGCGLTEEQTQILLRCALNPNAKRLAESIRQASAVMRVQGIPCAHSEATCRRWLLSWRDHNYHIWVFSREGAKALNDKVLPYIERDYSEIEVGDIIVADGHGLNFEIINPWTGKPQNHMALILFYDMKSNYPLGWEIMPTENTQAIASALRRAILRLGKLPKVAYLDNGRAFKARFFKGSNLEDINFTGLYERLGIQTVHAWPYHGQSKTVERFFGSLAELERMMPTYTGTSIEHKPPRMNRGERLHRKVHEKAFGGRVLTIEEAHILLAAWFDEYAQRPQRGHMEGACPAEVFTAGCGPGVDRGELAYLMMSIEVKHIKRNGITFQGQNYQHPALFGRKGGVVVRYDLQDLSCLYVFDKDGELICIAEPVVKTHPAAAQLGDSADQQLLIEHIEAKKSCEKAAATLARDFLRDEVLPEHQRMLARNGLTPDAPVIGSETNGAPKGKNGAKLISFDAEKVAREVAEQERWQAEAEAKDFRDGLLRLADADRYERLMEMEAQGLELADEWKGFMRFFEGMDEYKLTPDYWESCRVKYGLMYQSGNRRQKTEDR